MKIINNIIYFKDLNTIIKQKEYQYKILKFGAKWCKPCTEIKEDFTSFIKSLNNTNLIVVDIDIDEFVDIDEHYQLTKIPYFVIYDKEEIVAEFNSGQMHVIKANIESFIENDKEFVINEDF